MEKRYLIEALPLGILTIIGIYSIIEVSTTDYLFDTQQHIGLTLLFVSIFLFIASRKFYKYIFGLTLILGVINVVGFTTSITVISIMGIPFQIIVVPIIALFIWINSDEIMPKIQKLRQVDKNQIRKERNSQINGFIRRFEKLSDSEIDRNLKKFKERSNSRSSRSIKDY